MGANRAQGGALPVCLARLHPGPLLVFALVAAVGALSLTSPTFAAVSFACAALSACAVKGRSGASATLGLAVLAALIAAINPLFNTLGGTVLFTYAGGRPYTLEALAYGGVTGASFAAALLWFLCLNATVSADRLRALLGLRAPALALVLSMVARLVPRYTRRARELHDAQAGIGLGGRDVRSGARALSALVNWSLDDGVVSADSMRARGYGAVRRTSYRPLRWCRCDTMFCLVEGLLVAVFAAGASSGAASAAYVPTIEVPALGTPGLVALAAYALFLLVPALMVTREAVLWRMSLSKM